MLPHELLERRSRQQMLDGPARGGVPDDDDPLMVERERQFVEERRDPLDDLSIALATRKGSTMCWSFVSPTRDAGPPLRWP